MNIIVILTLVVSMAIGVLVGCLTWDHDEKLRNGFATFLGLGALTLIGWATIVWVYQPYEEDSCEQKTEGYGLEEWNYSFRHGCRVVLPTGQLVPEDRIRITSDGRITVVDE